MPVRECKATAASGEPCPSPALKGGDMCLWHDPTRQAEAELARRTGQAMSRLRGRNFKPDAVRLQTPGDWLNAIEALVKDIAAQPNGPHRVQAFTSLSKEAREWHLVQAAIGRDQRLIEGKVRRVR